MTAWNQLPAEGRDLISRANNLVMGAVGAALDTPTPDTWMTVGDARVVFVEACHAYGITPEDALPHV
ncbi:hypothetical protein ACWFMI_25115 [Nocardiopsis terrae]|uniref:hypothetical protein n=1 Tax=Streptomyces sp. NPDC057554 TaxID=3350538 RepID=UPI0036C0E5D2